MGVTGIDVVDDSFEETFAGDGRGDGGTFGVGVH